MLTLFKDLQLTENSDSYADSTIHSLQRLLDIRLAKSSFSGRMGDMHSRNSEILSKCGDIVLVYYQLSLSAARVPSVVVALHSSIVWRISNK
jgi:hypothetical protein